MMMAVIAQQRNAVVALEHLIQDTAENSCLRGHGRGLSCLANLSSIWTTMTPAVHRQNDPDPPTRSSCECEQLMILVLFLCKSAYTFILCVMCKLYVVMCHICIIL